MRKETQWLIIALLALAVLLPRVFDLGAFQAADEKMWVANTAGFTRNLALFKWDKLLQQPHPGITTQWLGAPAINADSLTAKKLPLALGQSVLIAFTGYIFYRLWGARPAVVLTLLLALNPPLIAHTRVYAMDSLLAHFLLLSVGLMLLWRKTNAMRYLIFAAATAALAVLSKLPGIIIIPFSIALLIYWTRGKHPSYQLRITSYWLLAFILTIVVVFPSLLLNFNEVSHLIKEFLLEGDVQDTHGPADYTYYLESLAFFSTPLQLAALILLPAVWVALHHSHPLPLPLRQEKTKVNPHDSPHPIPLLSKEREHTLRRRIVPLSSSEERVRVRWTISGEQIVIFLLFAALFVIQMTLGAKKGDRYILPAFLFLDTAVVLIFFSLTAWLKRIGRARLLLTTNYVLLTLLAWQAYDVARRCTESCFPVPYRVRLQFHR